MKIKAGLKVLKINDIKAAAKVAKNIDLIVMFDYNNIPKLDFSDCYEPYVLNEYDVIMYKLNPLMYKREIKQYNEQINKK